MAAKNGILKTLLFSIIFILLLVAMVIFTAIYVGGSMSNVLNTREAHSTAYHAGYHDHRI